MQVTSNPDIWNSTAIEGKEKSFPLNSSADLDPLMKRIGEAPCVLLGEASHGTHEYYAWRTAITKRLILEKGFNFLAVEGDWPDCYTVNKYIKGHFQPDVTAYEILQQFKRWPTWIWANWEIESLISWLKQYNDDLHPDKKIGFYGLDIYSLWESIHLTLDYLKKADPAAASLAQNAILCLKPYIEDEKRYSQLSETGTCREILLQLLNEIQGKIRVNNKDSEDAWNAEQNAQIALVAEEYYRNIQVNEIAWNLRDTHMSEILNRLMKFHGQGSKAIVWEHNTHIGDARFTNMKNKGMVNVGQLARESFGEENVILVGFGSHRGTVVAGKEWNSPIEIMSMPAAGIGSVEEILHHESPENKLLIFNKNDNKKRFNKELPHRAIGVVYRPENELEKNYVPTVLSSRYDAFLFLDKTRALYPMHIPADGNKIPETYPFSY